MTIDDLKKLEQAKKLIGFFQVDNETYHKGPGISNTNLGWVAQSPAHFKEYKENPPEQTKALRDGTRLHHAVLEPDIFEKKYILEPDRPARSKEDKEWWAQFEKELAENNQITCTKKDLDKTLRMRDAVFANEKARSLLKGVKELSAYCYDLDTGLLIKAKPDVINMAGLIVDIKGTTDASAKEFRRSCGNWRYHVQAQFHMDVVNQAIIQMKSAHKDKPAPDLVVGGRKITKVDANVLLVVEDSPPYGVALYTLGLTSLQKGFDEYKRNLTTLKECLDKNSWPSYGPEITEIELPTYF